MATNMACVCAADKEHCRKTSFNNKDSSIMCERFNINDIVLAAIAYISGCLSENIHIIQLICTSAMYTHNVLYSLLYEHEYCRSIVAIEMLQVNSSKLFCS